VRPFASKRTSEEELDLMAFLRNFKLMLVVHERATRMPPLKLKNKTASETLKCLITFYQGLARKRVKSMIFDNGGEFAKQMTLAQLLSTKSYFCDTYISRHKVGIENMNSRFRRNIPYPDKQT
jgi:IS30 family transposase